MKRIASTEGASRASSCMGPSRCSTIWRLRFVMPTATATVWLTVDGPMPLEEHLAAFNMGYCASMELAFNMGTSNNKREPLAPAERKP